jgi:hypothetical protein
VRISVDKPVGPIPRCVVGAYGSCYTLGYSSNADDNTRALIAQVRSFFRSIVVINISFLWQIAADNNIPPEEIISFKTEPEANRFLADNRNSTQGLFHVIIDYGCSALVAPSLIESCSGATHDATEIRGIKFAIQYNTTGFTVLGVAVDLNQYLVLPMQHAMHKAARTILAPFPLLPSYVNFAVRLFAQVPNFDVSTADFPRPAISPRNIVSSAGPFIIFGALMYNFVIQVLCFVRLTLHELF